MHKIKSLNEENEKLKNSSQKWKNQVSNITQ
jgi:hypothetical protein